MAFRRSQDTNHTNEAMSGINVTPLIDVMLCLLIIFLIAAPVLAERIPLDLPQPCRDCPKPPPLTPSRIEIGAAGEIRIDATPIARDLLEAEFALLKRRDPRHALEISAHPNAPFDAVAEVLGSAHNAGVSRIAFAR